MTFASNATVPPYKKLKVGQLVLVQGVRARILKKDARPQMLQVNFEDIGDIERHGKGSWVTYTSVNGILAETSPTDQVHPMLAKTAVDQAAIDKLTKDDGWWFEEKYDGERQILRYAPGGVGGNPNAFEATTRVMEKHTGRLGNNSAKLEHLAGVLVPDGGITVFDCELIHPRGFTALRSIMGSDPEEARKKQADIGPVHARLFDVLWLGGRDLRHIEASKRREILDEWYHDVADWLAAGGPQSGWWHYVDRAPRYLGAEKTTLLELILSAGGEGVMAKKFTAPYTDTSKPGQRSPGVMKIKPFTSDEFIIVGFEKGKGQYNQDKLGAVRLAQWVPNHLWPAEGVYCDGGVVSKVSFPSAGSYGLMDVGTSNIGTEEMEAAFRGDPELYIGSVMEVKYQLRWPKTLALRHPSLLRFRPDKTAADVIYEAGK